MKKRLDKYGSDDGIDIYMTFFGQFERAFEGLEVGNSSVDGRPTTQEIKNSLGSVMMGIALTVFQYFGLRQ